MRNWVTPAEIHSMLKFATQDMGLRKWCRMHGVSASMTSHYLRNGGSCPPVIVAALGYVREVRYVLRSDDNGPDLPPVEVQP